MANDSSEDEDEEEVEFAVGLTATDVIELVGLVSAQTDARIVDIISVGEGATITTGAVFARNAGSGQSFKCEGTETGWRIENDGDWIC